MQHQDPPEGCDWSKLGFETLYHVQLLFKEHKTGEWYSNVSHHIAVYGFFTLSQNQGCTDHGPGNLTVSITDGSQCQP